MSMKELAGMPAFEVFMERVQEKMDEAIKTLIAERVSDEKSRLQGGIQVLGWVMELADEMGREEEEQEEE